MKYYECPVSQTLGMKAYTQSCDLPVTCKSAASLKPVRSVHFPNDIVFQDYVRHGELERIGRIIRAGRVTLDTIYNSAIHEAVLTGNLECVKLLVHYGADIHQRDEEGQPISRSSTDLQHVWFPFSYLLSLGADPELENDCGEKPADLIDPENKELLRLFGLAVND
ncbi:hypothetical protein XENOCAPTIV_024224 [Xenoophorus captivus]|uniref:Uncharacterized protein n=1 Tax=Xenoophorus captivus TaxID=1517983 RepID=A0ABV0R4U3_9TELE